MIPQKSGLCLPIWIVVVYGVVGEALRLRVFDIEPIEFQIPISLSGEDEITAIRRPGWGAGKWTGI
jgi:hypothetical protein